MTEVTSQARHKQSRGAALEEVSLQMSAKSTQLSTVLWSLAP